MNIYIQDDTGSIPVAVDLPLQSWESFQLAGIDDTRLSSYVSGLSPQDIEELLSGNACIAKNPIPFVYEGQAAACTTLKVNDIITVNEKPMRVAAIADSPVSINNEGFVNGVQIILSDACYTTLTGQGRYSEVYPTLKKNADAAPFETWLDNFCNTNPGSHFLSYRQSDAQLAESFEQINKLCWGLILFIGFIGLLNIINTVYSNIHTRIAEIGIQRAIGMSVHSLYKTFLWEGAYYGIIAAVIGGVLGYICTIFVNAAAAGTGTLQLTPIPLLAIAEATILSIAACLLATAVPLRFISKMNIVDSIETLE